MSSTACSVYHLEPLLDRLLASRVTECVCLLFLGKSALLTDNPGLKISV